MPSVAIAAQLSIRPQESIHSQDAHETVHVTKPLWDQLQANVPLADRKDTLPVALAVERDAFQMHTGSVPASKALMNSIVARATLHRSSIDGHVAEEADKEVFVTSTFLRHHAPLLTIDGHVGVRIKQTDLVVLDEAILATLSAEAYEALSSEPSRISAYFLPASGSPVIVRYDQVYHIPGPAGSPLPVKVLMCNSVLQGILDHDTSIILTDISSNDIIRPSDQTPFEDAISSTQLCILDELEELNINSDFIASRFLARDSTNTKNNYKELYFSVTDLDDEGDEEDDDEDNALNSYSDVMEDSGDEIDGQKINRSANGHSTFSRARQLEQDHQKQQHHQNSKSTAIEFSPWVQQSQYPVSKLSPRPTPEDDPEARIYVDVAQLARLKVFSGDWVTISGKQPGSKARFCRIYGLEFPAEGSKAGLARLYMSAGLHFNLGAPTVVKVDAAPLKQELSVAHAVTVARVASPATVDKALQTACLEALKDWFEEYERVVCEGDVIAVQIDTEAAMLVPKQLVAGELSEDVQLTLPPSAYKTTVYFKLSHLEDSARPNMHTQLVDPSVTKMIQSGLEHSKIPPQLRPSPRSPVIPALTDSSAPGSFAQLYQLVSSGLHPFSSTLGLNCTVLLHGARGIGKKTVVGWVAGLAGIHLMDVNCFDIASETDAKTEVAVRAKFDKAVACGPCILLLRNIDALARKSVALETGQEPILSTVLKDCFTQLGESFKTMGHPVTVIATTSDVDKVPTSVLGCFLHEIGYDAPSEPQRLAILQNLTINTPLGPDVSLTSLATQTAALVAKDLVDLVSRAGLVALDRIELSCKEWNSGIAIAPSSLVDAGVAITAADFDAALGKARASYSDSIGAPKIPNVTWDDVGGLASVKNDILDTIQLPLEHPELFASGLKKRSGILLYGPPGTGKTLLAKAVATSCSLNFFSVKGPELLNMYIGESEANVRRVFQRARDAKPCVIFFDELDSVAPKRGEKGDSGGVMDRIVSQLLAELDGMNGGEGSGDVFVIGATNRPDLLDPALLRPGRFDKLLYLSVSTKHEEQLRIIQALTRKFRLHPNLDLRNVAEKCPFNYTGADFYALCSDAMLKSMSRTADGIESRVKAINADQTSTLPRPITSQYYLDHLSTPEEILVQVTEEDFDQALAELIPSVSAQELEHYKQVQKMFNSDDFEKEAQATAAAEEEKRAASRAVQEAAQNDKELQDALQKFEQAQELLAKEAEEVMISAVDQQRIEEVQAAKRGKGKGKGKARA